MKKGKFIGIGVGPGDPDLLTIKAVKALEDVDVICAPKSREEKPSLALSIVQGILDNKKNEYKLLEPLFPMIEDEDALKEYWNSAAVMIRGELDVGLDVAFITLGDPTVYSTFAYVFQRIKDFDYDTSIIPGITSFTGCAATAKIALAEKDEIMVVVPKVDDRLSKILEHGDTFVIMKTSRHSQLLEEIINKDKRIKDVISVQNCSMQNERITDGFLNGKKYLSTTIVKFRDEGKK